MLPINFFSFSHMKQCEIRMNRPNPFYVKELKELTGLDESVREYVLKFPETQQYVEKLINLLDYSLPMYKEEGKSELVIAIGCTGGKHRSVTLARLLNSH